MKIEEQINSVAPILRRLTTSTATTHQEEEEIIGRSLSKKRV